MSVKQKRWYVDSMSVIIKKEMFVPQTGESEWCIVYNGAPLPCKVSVIPGKDRELRMFLFRNYGSGNYYVYRLGGNPQYQQYFRGTVGRVSRKTSKAAYGGGEMW